MHTLPDFLSWSVLSCLSFSRTLQILAMAHVSQVGVSCVPFPGLPPTELPRWAHRPSLPGSTHRGYRGLGDTGLGERVAAVLPEQKHL